MSQKIQVKFYPLTSDITTMLRKGKLTAAEWRIWSYLVEVDPWGDRYQDLDSLDVMSKCDCSRATFYRAIAKLQKLGLFDIQDKGFSIRNLTGASTLKSVDEKTSDQKLRKGNLKNETSSVSKIRNETSSVSKIRLESQNCESSLKNETGFSKMRLDSQICDNRPPESPPDKAFKSPQTIQTYTDFKQTLSESERDNFLNFVKEETHNLQKPINDIEAWLASKNAVDQNRWEVYYKNYQEQKIKQKSRNSTKNSGSGNLSPDKKQAIAEFRKRMQLNQPVDEPESKDTNSEEYQQKKAVLDELLANPPEREKSLNQQRREAIALFQRQQQELNRKRKEAATERAKQLDQDYEQRKAEMLRQIEELSQRQQQQNTEINSEDSEHE